MLYKSHLREYEDYVGEHSAPTNDGYCSPLYDVTLNGTYPEDIYSSNAKRYYGDGISSDSESVYIIQSMRNKPNRKVKIYRAVPDINYDIDIKIKEINSALNYKHRYGFFPMDNKKGFDYFKSLQIDIENKIEHIRGYDERNNEFITLLNKEQENLRKQKQKKLSINEKDWISISKTYATEHGHHALNSKFKILTKTVKASQIWTDGNSINEWGYDV